MRGITTMHYRKAFVRHFDGLDAEMAPFISTVAAEKINPKLLRDVLPEHNSGLPLIPQLIGKSAPEFIAMARALHELGFRELNWNLGCPHKPIRNKGRGSGLLSQPETVDRLLAEICADSPCRLSVKVRLGVANSSELFALIPVLNRYPLSEVIIHPRTAEQMYEGAADRQRFAEAAALLTHRICYNGDITDLAFFQSLAPYCRGVERFMLGRGLLANPFLCEQIKRASPRAARPLERLRAFHDDVFESYRTVIDGDRPMLGKMKEFWSYPARHLSNGRTFLKKVKKCQRLTSYCNIVDESLRAARWTA